MKYLLPLLSLLFFITACNKEEDVTTLPPEEGLYFPPKTTTEWSSISPEELGWDTRAIDDLLSYLETNNTRAFLLLKDGKIVVEEYFGNTILGTAPFNANSQWYWASAGKTLTATLVGIAQQEGYLSIDEPSSNYLGEGWTSLSSEKENLITIKHQLTMTTGLDYDVVDVNCTTPDCLQYKTDAGDQWFYHNAPYTLLEKVVENATNLEYNTYTDQKLEATIGMKGQWRSQGFNNVYWSTARDMARFGLLILNKGKWEDTAILTDDNYYNQMTNTSQLLNPSYGYLWWLNGKSSIIFPSIAASFNIPLASDAPSDLFAGMGKNGQYVGIVPSENLVLIRMGEAPDDGLVPITFHNEMWEKIDLIFE